MSNRPKVYVSKWERLMLAIYLARSAILILTVIAIVFLLLTLAAGGRPQFLP